MELIVLPKRTDTYELAYRACTELFGETGKMPTIASVKDRISVNSPVTIKKAIDDWLIHLAAEFINRRKNPGIPDVLFEGISSIWNSALFEAEKSFNQKVKQLAEKETSYKQDLQLAVSQVENANQEKSQVLERFKDQDHYVQHLKEDLKNLRFEHNSLIEENKQVQQSLEVNKTKCTNLQAKYDESQQHWEGRFDKEQNWMLNRIQEEKDRVEQSKSQELNRLLSEVKNHKFEKASLEARLDQAQNLADRLLKKNDELGELVIKLQKQFENNTLEARTQIETINKLKKQLADSKASSVRAKRQTRAKTPKK